MATPQQYDYLFKILMLGDSGAGKTSLLLRFSDNEFNEIPQSTIGVDFKIKTIQIDNKIIKLQIWDTGGQERFASVGSSYFRGTDGILLVYDVANDQSFNGISRWLKDIQHNNLGDDVPCIIVANKIDKPERVVTTEMGQELANRLGMKYIETSAKASHNVEQAYSLLVSHIREEAIKENLTDTITLNIGDLGEDDTPTNTGTCCY